MILVDTSVWVQHLRRGERRLSELLEHDLVACHPFLIGELAMGSLRRRSEILRLLQQLHAIEALPQGDVLTFVDRRELFSLGLGWVDAHLLASAVVAKVPLWTFDRRLDRAAHQVGVAARFK